MRAYNDKRISQVNTTYVKLQINHGKCKDLHAILKEMHSDYKNNKEPQPEQGLEWNCKFNK